MVNAMPGRNLPVLNFVYHLNIFTYVEYPHYLPRIALAKYRQCVCYCCFCICLNRVPTDLPMLMVHNQCFHFMGVHLQDTACWLRFDEGISAEGRAIQ